MKHQHLIVGGQPQIALDARTELERRSESDQAILWKAGAIMQAPVREPLGPGIERVSP